MRQIRINSKGLVWKSSQGEPPGTQLQLRPVPNATNTHQVEGPSLEKSPRGASQEGPSLEKFPAGASQNTAPVLTRPKCDKYASKKWPRFPGGASQEGPSLEKFPGGPPRPILETASNTYPSKVRSGRIKMKAPIVGNNLLGHPRPPWEPSRAQTPLKYAACAQNGRPSLPRTQPAHKMEGPALEKCPGALPDHPSENSSNTNPSKVRSGRIKMKSLIWNSSQGPHPRPLGKTPQTKTPLKSAACAQNGIPQFGKLPEARPRARLETQKF